MGLLVVEVAAVEGGVAAAELVLLRVGGGVVGGVVVVEHEVVDGFSGESTPLHRDVEVQEDLRPANAFP